MIAISVQTKSLVHSILMVMVLCQTLGCGSRVTVDDNRSSQVAFDEALNLVDSGSYAQALPLLDKAIASGGLSADFFATALLLRSRCHCDAGDLEKAKADLEHADQGSPSPAQLQLTKGFLLAKQGKKTEADAAFKAAKKVDPSIKLPKS